MTDPSRDPQADQRGGKSVDDQNRPYSGTEARQGQVVLTTRTRRWVFFGGLIAFVVLVFIWAALA